VERVSGKPKSFYFLPAIIILAAVGYAFLISGNKLHPVSEDAARAALRQYNPKSISENIEYGGFIYRTSDRRYGYTQPTKGNFGKVKFAPLDKSAPKNASVIASWHTHGAHMEGVISEIFSPQDIQFNQKHKINGYLGTPNGNLVFFDRGTGQSTILGPVID